MRLISLLLGAHIAALVFGLAGLLIAVPNPHLWADSDLGVHVYRLGMRYAGASHIVLAALAMTLVGFRFLGARKTLVFLVATVAVSLTAELVGTTTGFPFGAYSYTSGLGYKILGEVPFTIPLSWFYMGLSSFLLAGLLARGPLRRWPLLTAVIGGAFLLTAWDLVLDPAMAHTELSARFWIWHDSGAYFGMPAQNFAGWFATGVAFMGLSALAWRGSPRTVSFPPLVPYLIYMANMVFAMAISAGTGLWWPIVIALVLGVGPATYALIVKSRSILPDTESTLEDDAPESMPGSPNARRALVSFSRLILARGAKVQVEGLENIPETGPVILAARHYHHLYDGCALLSALPRPAHILVALDWVEGRLQRKVMESACGLAGWPVVLRRERLRGGDDGGHVEGSAVYSPEEFQRCMLRGWRDAVGVLEAGEALVVFPEGYPTIDPHGTQDKGEDGFFPFRTGFARLAATVERRTGRPVPIVPVGLSYERSDRWQISIRVSPPVSVSAFPSVEHVATAVQESVVTSSRSVPKATSVRSDQIVEAS